MSAAASPRTVPRVPSGPADAQTRELSSRAVQIGRALVIVTILLIASRQFVVAGLTLGHLATFATAPIWLGALRRSVGATWLLVLGVVATASSLWLTVLASQDHATTPSNVLMNTMLVLSVGTEVGVLVWARGLLPVWLIGAVFGTGMFISAVTRQDLLAHNAWKFAFGIPAGVLLLALARRTGRRWVEVTALLALALTSAALDSRSYFAEFAVAAALVVWQGVVRGGGRRSALRVIGIFGVLLVAAYNLGTEALTAGLLGEATQARSLAQIDRAGSIIAGGRPELGASIALFLHRPIGFGAGTIANYDDIQAAKQGMAALNYNPDNGYVENFLFGLKVELHSMLGDLWAYAGVFGVVLALFCIALLLVVVGRGIAERAISGLVLFAVVQSLWSFFFNPVYASEPVLVLALGLGLPLAAGVRRERRKPGPSGSTDVRGPRSGGPSALMSSSLQR